ncbi:biotin/lipoyl-containing protein [Microbacterium sp. No. 7]|uniref:biotin/lipoyl-containing protein n=1 Tax=Microbacterium sp. No. 7 TaxID=1714373 RepID=UPI0006D0D569|nr:biotin/lipoyl-containing protein [Microbacterium sp. No. 7]ALJ18434.1 hypothetical protein AOA12_00270 [Microbacterium sp. No. 7]
MPIKVTLPQWGMGMSEGTIVEWLVSVGDEVAAGDGLVEIETAKASDTVTAPAAGTVRELIGEVDDDVPVGEVLVVIDEQE